MTMGCVLETSNAWGGWRDELEGQLDKAVERQRVAREGFLGIAKLNRDARSTCMPMLRPFFAVYADKEQARADEIRESAVGVLNEFDHAAGGVGSLAGLVGTLVMRQELDLVDVVLDQLERTMDAVPRFVISGGSSVREGALAREIEFLLKASAIAGGTAEAIEHAGHAIELETEEMISLAESQMPAGAGVALSRLSREVRDSAHEESRDNFWRAIVNATGWVGESTIPVLAVVMKAWARMREAARACELEYTGRNDVDVVHETRRRFAAIRELRETAREVLVELQGTRSEASA